MPIENWVKCIYCDNHFEKLSQSSLFFSCWPLYWYYYEFCCYDCFALASDSISEFDLR